MKKFFFLAAIAATLVISISSCGKKEEVTDLTTDIVGTYVGTVQDTMVGTTTQQWNNETVVVTKIDDDNVHVAAGSGGVLSSFNASVATASDGFALTAAPQTSGSYNLSGTAKYVSSTNKLNVIMYLLDGSGTTVELYIGTK